MISSHRFGSNIWVSIHFSSSLSLHLLLLSSIFPLSVKSSVHYTISTWLLFSSAPNGYPLSCFLAFPLGTLHYQSSLLLFIGGTIVFRQHLLYRLTSTSAVPFRSPLLRNPLLPFLLVLRCFSSLLLWLSLSFSLQGICSPLFPSFGTALLPAALPLYFTCHLQLFAVYNALLLQFCYSHPQIKRSIPCTLR